MHPEDHMPHTREHDGVVDNSPMAKQTTELARDVRDATQRKADAGIERAAEGMRAAADKLRERADHVDGLRSDAGERVADTLGRSADYLRDHDSEQLLGEVKAYVRKHPVQAVASAIVGGLLFGKFFL
jgi:ElaB/YqjD/DUF883 family membrane-anchored ribosome-binding protein